MAAGAGFQRHGNLLNQRKRPAAPPYEGKRGSDRVTWWELFNRKYRTTNSGARRGSAADVLIGMLIEEINPAARWCTWDTPMSSNHKIEALSFASAAGNSGRVWRRATG